jgi:polyisoprenoid-binding protein YceI
VLLLLQACSDPAAGVSAAELGEAAPANRGAAEDPAKDVERLAITPEHGRIEWVAAKLHVEEAGSFERFSGEVRFHPTQLNRSEVDVRIDTASLHAEPDRLADHLRDVDFFDVEHFPQARFRSVAIEAAPEGGDAMHRITGDLTLHGVTRRITFPAQVRAGAQLRVRAEFSIDRTAFGIAENRPDHLIRHRVVIRLALDLPRP